MGKKPFKNYFITPMSIIKSPNCFLWNILYKLKFLPGMFFTVIIPLYDLINYNLGIKKLKDIKISSYGHIKKYSSTYF